MASLNIFISIEVAYTLNLQFLIQFYSQINIMSRTQGKQRSIANEQFHLFLYHQITHVFSKQPTLLCLKISCYNPDASYILCILVHVITSVLARSTTHRELLPLHTHSSWHFSSIQSSKTEFFDIMEALLHVSYFQIVPLSHSRLSLEIQVRSLRLSSFSPYKTM